MVQRKLNKKRVALAIIILVVFILLVVFGILFGKNLIKKNSIEYKLETIGYKVEEIDYIKKNFNEDEQKELLKGKYISILIPLYKEKYFRKDKLSEYLEYYEKNKDLKPSEIITKINTHTNIDFYDEVYDADTSKKELVLVNKYYKLDSEYEPDDIVLVPSTYAYSGKYISNSILESVEELIDAAKDANHKLVVSSGYRSYAEQEKLYNNYKVNNGVREADTYVSRPGHSDYQTGLALDIEPYFKYIETPSESEEYKWLKDNSYKYGFIIRYPKGKESITGFKFSTWHLRYVGVEAATYIHNNDITFEEYYGYKF